MRKKNSTLRSTVSRCFFIFLSGIVLLWAAGIAAAPEETQPKSKSPYYEFVLSPEVNAGIPDPDYYSRREIESFLCTFAPEFISLRDVYKEHSRVPFDSVGEGRWYIKKNGIYNRYFVKNKTVTPEKRHLL